MSKKEKKEAAAAPQEGVAVATMNVYCGATPQGDIVVNCVKGVAVNPASLAQFKEKLIAAGAISAAPKHTREKDHGQSK